MMNKGLEMIEAHWLFGVPPDRIEVVVHPQSVIHSLVEYVDGSVLAQLGNPDMRTPIAQALAFPDRVDAGVPALELVRQGRSRSSRPTTTFSCVGLARMAARWRTAGGSQCRERSRGRRYFPRACATDIAPACAEALAPSARPVHALEDALAADSEARAVARA
jgi:1-deoxy-D-xylulose-5-phosphate reductoisomerase